MNREFIKTDAADRSELLKYRDLSEKQLCHIYEPKPGLFIAESPKVITRALDGGYEPESFLVDEADMTEETAALLLRCGDVPVYTADKKTLASITGFVLTRGILCAMKRRPETEAGDICAGAGRIAVLEDVVNPTNVGAVIRSAAALGIEAVLLTRGCADPLYRRAARVSMGTVFQIPWTYIDKVSDVKKLGFKTAALALLEDTLSIDDPQLKSTEKLALVLGSEGEGLKKETIYDCDYTVKIPMYHGVDSLNVAAASAVAFWELGRRG